MKICRIAPHFYEEPPISGKNGSGTIFFSGCSLDCEFCQNHEISKAYVGKTYSPAELADAIFQLEQSGVHNINFVTPTHFSDRIAEALTIYRPKIPVVYNTSGYELPSVTEKICSFVDIFLVDMKYSDDAVASRYSRVSDYVRFNRESTEIMVRNKPLVFDGDLMKQGVIIRHLVLPGELPNTFGVIDHYAEKYAESAYLSVMAQFFPAYKSKIKRTLSPLEYKIVLNRLYKANIGNCFVQDLSSASDSFVPDFSLT